MSIYKLGKRKIQETAGGSYITTIPLSWVENNDLSQGDEILFKLTKDGSLKIEPKEEE